MTTVRRALALSFLERYLSIVLALGSGMVLARLLTPEQIGMYSVTLAVIGLAHVLREFGVGNYLIQQKDLNDDHVRTAFGLALGMGGTLAVVIYVAAPWVGRFYSAPEMAGLMRIVALNFLVLPFCSISLSLLRRDMKFKALLYVNLMALCLGTGVTLALAWTGHGPTSMAVGAVVGNVATGFGAWLARDRPAPLRPGWKEWRTVLNFGGQSAATGLLTAVAMDINDLVVGKILGFAPVAIFSRAQGLINLIQRDAMSAVRNVALPSFAAQYQQAQDLEQAHTHATSCITAFSWTFLGFLAGFPLPILRFLYGPQWDVAAYLVPWLALASAIAAPCSLVTTLLIACGRIDLVTKLEFIVQGLRLLVIVVSAVIFKSLLAVAIATSLVFSISAVVIYIIKGRAIRTNWLPWVKSMSQSALVAMCSLALPIALSLLTPPDHIVFNLVIPAFMTIVVWPIAVVIFRHPLRNEPIFKNTIAKLAGNTNLFSSLKVEK